MKFCLLVSFVTALLTSIEAGTYGENLLARLNTDIRHMNDLIVVIQEYYREERSKKVHVSYPRNYDSTLRRASGTIGKALRLMKSLEGTNRRSEGNFNPDDGTGSSSVEQNSGESSRRNNQQLQWRTNFYKALSRALKDEFQNEKLIQEYVHDGFVPPTFLKRTRSTK